MSQLTGHLELTCSADGQGRSYLSHQSFRTPFHISKSYWDDHALMVQVINPTAGLFSGDSLRSEVRVENGAKLHITTPSASRIHTMPNGRAELEQRFHVASGAWLEFYPAALIPQNKGRYRQATQIEVETGGELFFVETLAPGRVAHGECFRFQEIDWECNVTCGKRLVARERFFLRPDDASVQPLKQPFPEGYYASCYVITERMTEEHPVWEAIRQFNSEDVQLGVSRLIAAGWSIKLLARDSLVLNKAVQAIRRCLAEVLPGLRSESRKL